MHVNDDDEDMKRLWILVWFDIAVPTNWFYSRCSICFMSLSLSSRHRGSWHDVSATSLSRVSGKKSQLKDALKKHQTDLSAAKAAMAEATALCEKEVAEFATVNLSGDDTNEYCDGGLGWRSRGATP